MDKEKLARVFNEWMRRYTEEPERYASEFAVVRKFLAEQEAGKEPEYGSEMAAYFLRLCDEVWS